MQQKNEAIQRLHEVLKPGDTVWTILRHRRGDHRRISLIKLVIKDNGEVQPYVLDYLCEQVGLAKHKMTTRYGMDGRPYKDREEGLVTSGGGMDMGFDLVYNLGKIMWPKGTPDVHGTRNGEPDRDGGYALNHRWL